MAWSSSWAFLRFRCTFLFISLACPSHDRGLEEGLALVNLSFSLPGIKMMLMLRPREVETHLEHLFGGLLC